MNEQIKKRCKEEDAAKDNLIQIEIKVSELNKDAFVTDLDK